MPSKVRRMCHKNNSFIWQQQDVHMQSKAIRNKCVIGHQKWDAYRPLKMLNLYTRNFHAIKKVCLINIASNTVTSQETRSMFKVLSKSVGNSNIALWEKFWMDFHIEIYPHDPVRELFQMLWWKPDLFFSM